MNAGRTVVRIGLLAICLVVAVTVLGGGSLLAEPVDAQSESPLAQQTNLETDTVRIGIDLHENGSATWSIEFWSALEDDDRTAAFESLQDDIQANPANYTQSFAQNIGNTVDAARASTDREMNATGFRVATERQTLGREYGVVRYSFEWTGFARIEGEELHAGDTIEGLFLDDGTRLLISWPDGYEPQSVRPEPDDRRDTAVIWQGATTEFVSGEPRVVVVAPTATGSTPDSGLLAGIVGLVVLIGGVTGWVLRRRSTATATDETDVVDHETNTETEPTDTAGSKTDTKSNESQAAVDSTAPASTATEDESDSSNPETALLSNEEQVMQLLETNGGRMKQQTVVGELDWTDAKTSKVVSKLRENDSIESFRIGRENVLTIPADDTEESTR